MPLILRCSTLLLEEGHKISDDITVIAVDQDTFTCVSDNGLCCVYDKWTLDSLSDNIDVLVIKPRLMFSGWTVKAVMVDRWGEYPNQSVGVLRQSFGGIQGIMKNYSQLISPVDHEIVKVNIRWKLNSCQWRESIYLVKNPSLRKNASRISLCGDDCGFGWYDDISGKFCFNQKRINVNFNTVVHSAFYDEELGNIKTALVSLSRASLEEITEFTKNLGE